MVKTMPKPVAVKALADYQVWLRYDDGAEGTVDLSDLAGRGVFKAWGDPAFFKAEWSMQHQQELLALWERAKRHDTIGRLAPLS